MIKQAKSHHSGLQFIHNNLFISYLKLIYLEEINLDFVQKMENDDKILTILE